MEWVGKTMGAFIYYLLLLLHQQLTGSSCACVSASERERAIARKREGSKKRASRKSRHTNIHTAANLIKNIK